MRTFNITFPDNRILQDLQHAIDQKTKPIGALGKLELIAIRAGHIQQTLRPIVNLPHMIVFAGDHGIAATGMVNPYPQEVTFQMVQNFLWGGAAINVLCRQHRLALKVVNAGVNTNNDWEDPHHLLINSPIAQGTANYLTQPAITAEQCSTAINDGAALVAGLHETGCNTIGFGEMGIGNTSSASLIMHALTGLPVETCTGKGTGAGKELLLLKIKTLEQAATFHQLNQLKENPLEVLQRVGGFEIAMMTGAFLAAAEKSMLIVVDGFIACAAFLVAQKLYPQLIHYAFFAHCSAEKGHQLLLDHFHADPVLHLNMRLGEGTGAAMAIPILQSSIAILNEMASFASAGISEAN